MAATESSSRFPSRKKKQKNNTIRVGKLPFFLADLIWVLGFQVCSDLFII